jgi:selT/selW/selH-like putative selenoprotein
LAAFLQERVGARVDLVPGARGGFEVIAADRLVFSKLATGRFPEPEEILAALPRA